MDAGGEHRLFGGERPGDATNATYKYVYWAASVATSNNPLYSNPQFFHQDYMANSEYRIRFADRIYKHMFNNGVMTVQEQGPDECPGAVC